MYSPNEFWLNLHRLASAYDAEGATIGERNANITRQFEDMPYLAQQEVLKELQSLVHRLPELYPAISNAANASARVPAAALTQHAASTRHEGVA
jgi:hypothetical protein